MDEMKPMTSILGDLSDELVQASRNPGPLSDLPTSRCWRCRDSGWQPVVTGNDYAVRLCICQRRKILHALRVPPAFKKPVLGRLKPKKSNHGKQAQVIKRLKANPSGSYLFTGSNGSGKTHFSWALCRAALIRGQRVRALLLSELMSQYRAYEVRPDAESPSVISEDLKRGYSYTIFLDEFDKVNTTEFTSRKLFELLNAVRDFEHQLLITSNREWAELRSVWSRVDEMYGDSIMKRIEQCELIEMF